MGFLMTILILVLIYYFLKIVGKWFAPRLFAYAAKKTEQHFKERFGEFQSQQASEEEQIGDVIIDKSTMKKTKPSKKVGDYIDFEEID
ncbi:DUF4834 family protein [Spongiimicrobium salis]|uniref:DUF4834 family protein n=1 Tax=Spongiimicrobium salis TaxID=1667022 RepID=UPI00374CCF84